MMNLSYLKKHVPDGVMAQLPEVQTRFEINTPSRLCHFLAQCSHESLGFTKVYENLNYSARGLLTVFPKYFTPEQAEIFARKPEAIANRVYANRMGNGPTTGYFYRGRGFFMLTGLTNYSLFGLSIGENTLVRPDLVATKYPLVSAAWYWHSRGLNAYADANDCETVTRKINGGLIGLSDRLDRLRQFQEAFV